MPMPKVKTELINTIGTQMFDDKYMRKISDEFDKENPSLAGVLGSTIEVMRKCVSNKEECEGAEVILVTTILAMYQSLKQQMICDEF